MKANKENKKLDIEELVAKSKKEGLSSIDLDEVIKQSNRLMEGLV